MAHARAVRVDAGGANGGHFSTSPGRRRNIFLSRLRVLYLSAGIFPSGGVLAGGIAAVESAEQLRPAVSRAVEHNDAVSRLADLSAAAAPMVAELLLPGAHVPGGVGSLFFGISVDRQSSGGHGGRGD